MTAKKRELDEEWAREQFDDIDGTMNIPNPMHADDHETKHDSGNHVERCSTQRF